MPRDGSLEPRSAAYISRLKRSAFASSGKRQGTQGTLLLRLSEALHFKTTTFWALFSSYMVFDASLLGSTFVITVVLRTRKGRRAWRWAEERWATSTRVPETRLS